MKNCTSPQGHEWSSQIWVEQEYQFWTEGFHAETPVTHFEGHTSQTVTCLHCGETGYLIKSPV